MSTREPWGSPHDNAPIDPLESAAPPRVRDCDDVVKCSTCGALLDMAIDVREPDPVTGEYSCDSCAAISCAACGKPSLGPEHECPKLGPVCECCHEEPATTGDKCRDCDVGMCCHDPLPRCRECRAPLTMEPETDRSSTFYCDRCAGGCS